MTNKLVLFRLLQILQVRSPSTRASHLRLSLSHSLTLSVALSLSLLAYIFQASAAQTAKAQDPSLPVFWSGIHVIVAFHEPSEEKPQARSTITGG
jgi:hypothetical protein